MRLFIKFVPSLNVKMKQRFLFLFVLFLSLQTISAAELPFYSTGFDPARDAFADGRDAIKRATASDRLILIELGGDWCKWCHKFDNFLNNNPEVKKELHNTFVLLKVNVSDENYNEEFLKVFPRPYGYPHMYITQSNGQLLHSKDTGQFVVNGQYSVQKFKEFFILWNRAKKVVQG